MGFPAGPRARMARVLGGVVVDFERRGREGGYEFFANSRGVDRHAPTKAEGKD
jgi:hypothetical protein